MTTAELATLIITWPVHYEELMMPQIMTYCKLVRAENFELAEEYRQSCHRYNVQNDRSQETEAFLRICEESAK